jgi:uncharacterized protein (DUF1015 family)
VARIRPFVGLLYDPAVAGPIDELTSPPYDAITPSEQARLHARSQHNVARLIRGMDRPGDDARNNRYSRAARDLARWRADGVLRATERPAVYPYEFRFLHGGLERAVRGVIAEVELTPFNGVIVPHEGTMAEPTRDRVSLLRAVRANLSPVHAVYRGPAPAMRRLIESAAEGPPSVEVTDEEGTRHRLWEVYGAHAALETVDDMPLMIADGHHRYAAAVRIRDEMDAAAGAGPWDAMMMLLIDAAVEDPPVLPIHRAIVEPERRPTDDRTPEHRPTGQLERGLRPTGDGGAAIPSERVRDLAELLPALRDDVPAVGVVTRDGAELRHEVLRLGGRPPAVRELHRRVLVGVDDERLAFVPDAVEAEDLVRSGRAIAAYVLPATSVRLVRDVIATGERLPQKSTYFWPKPRSGLVIRAFDL